MGIYTDILKERESNNRRMVELGNEILDEKNGFTSEYDTMGEAQLVIHGILRHFGEKNQKWLSGQNDMISMLDCMLDPLYIMYEEVELTDNILQQRTDYILAFTEDGHALELSPFLVGYRYKCPATGQRGLVNRDKNLKLQPKAYILYRPFRKVRRPTLDFVVLMLRLICMRDVIPLVLTTAFITTLSMAVPSINQKVLSEILPMGATKEGIRCLLVAASYFVGVRLAKGVFQIVKNSFLSRTRLRLSAQVQAAVMARVLLQPVSFFSDESSGKLSVKIKNSRNLASTVIDQFFNTGITAIFSIQYIPQMLKYAPELVIPALILLAVQLGISVLTSVVAMNNERELLEAQVENNNFTFQCMKGAQKIKGIGAESRIFYIWSSLYHRILKHSLNQPKLSMLSEPIGSFLSSVTTIILLCMAVIYKVPYADYTAFVASFGLASGVMETMVASFTSVIRMQPKFRQLKELVMVEEESQSAKEYVQKLKGRITVDHVSFQYGSATFSCLRNISLEIKPGEKVAIVGESGCGKSTLLKLLLGLEIPEKGTISYDGIPMGQINLRSLRRHIGSVFQFSRVIPGTIRENILFSTGDHSMEDVWRAAEDAAIAEDIRSLPLGMETEITDTNSGGFSGGQKQRILLARAFVSNPSILLLDEATSALDNLTQAHVLESVYKMKATVIMVAHRLSTVKNCDRIIVLKEGKIEEEGRYEELIQKEGYFAKLVEKQTLENHQEHA